MLKPMYRAAYIKTEEMLSLENPKTGVKKRVACEQRVSSNRECK